MTRAEKREAILAALNEDRSRSDRAIAKMIGVSQVTVGAARRNLNAVQIERVAVQIEPEHPASETEHRDASVQIEGRKLNTVQNGLDWLHDPAKRTPAAAAAWFAEMFPQGIDRLIMALNRHRDASSAGSAEITINWEAGKAARDLARLWSTERLDELCAEIASGAPIRMTETEKLAIWGSDKAPKSISIPDDPVSAAAKLWLFWGARPSKLTRLRYEIGRRTKAPEPIWSLEGRF